MLAATTMQGRVGDFIRPTVEPAVMNRWLSAVAGGVTGISVMSVLLLLLDVETRSAVGIFDAVARFVGMPGNTAVGFVFFFLAGSFLWPALFVAVEDYLPGGPDPGWRGIAFSIPLWFVFLAINVLSAGVTGAIVILFVLYTFAAHAIYGFTMGAVYAHLTGSGPAHESPGASTPR